MLLAHLTNAVSYNQKEMHQTSAFTDFQTIQFEMLCFLFGS